MAWFMTNLRLEFMTNPAIVEPLLLCQV